MYFYNMKSFNAYINFVIVVMFAMFDTYGRVVAILYRINFPCFAFVNPVSFMG